LIFLVYQNLDSNFESNLTTLGKKIKHNETGNGSVIRINITAVRKSFPFRN